MKATKNDFEDISVGEVNGSPQDIATTITLGSSCDFARHVGHAGRFYLRSIENQGLRLEFKL